MPIAVMQQYEIMSFPNVQSSGTLLLEMITKRVRLLLTSINELYKTSSWSQNA